MITLDDWDEYDTLSMCGVRPETIDTEYGPRSRRPALVVMTVEQLAEYERALIDGASIDTAMRDVTAYSDYADLIASARSKVFA